MLDKIFTGFTEVLTVCNGSALQPEKITFKLLEYQVVEPYKSYGLTC